jgi:hypothetical protein
LRNANTGETSGSLMDAMKVLSFSLVMSDLSWNVIGTLDINGDEKSDMVWRNSLSGEITVWKMNGTKILNGGPLLTDKNTKVDFVFPGKMSDLK